MASPTPRSDLVAATREAYAIVCEGIPFRPDGSAEEVTAARAAALPVMLRELLDVEVAPDPVVLA